MQNTKPGYEYLITYQNAVAIFDETCQFCDKFIDKRSRTFDQMVQAARSSKQCIPEGYMQNSLKGYIKLLGVTRGSYEELLQDYYDFGRNHGVEIREKWDKEEKRDKFGKYLLPIDPLHPFDPFIPVNHLVNLIRRTNYLLDRQIKALEEKFIREGGYTENLFKQRLSQRSKIQNP
jgi:four helix bundle suffix protein